MRKHEWMAKQDDRRCELIDRDLAGTITDEERTELARLQAAAERHFDRVAPPHLKGAERLLERLLRRRDDR